MGAWGKIWEAGHPRVISDSRFNAARYNEVDLYLPKLLKPFRSVEEDGRRS